MAHKVLACQAARGVASALCAWLCVSSAYAQSAAQPRPETSRPDAAKPDTRKPPPPASPQSQSQPSVRPQQSAPPANAQKPAASAPQASSPQASSTQASEPQAPAPVTAQGPGELQPVLHARDANLAVCMDHVVAQAGVSIDGAHTAASTWSTAAPDANPFTSIVGLSYPNQMVPNGLAVMLSAPMPGGRCAGGVIQVYPTSNSCSVVQAGLIKSGKTLGALQKLPLVQTGDGARTVLMPTAGGGCVVVSVRQN